MRVDSWLRLGNCDQLSLLWMSSSFLADELGIGLAKSYSTIIEPHKAGLICVESSDEGLWSMSPAIKSI